MGMLGFKTKRQQMPNGYLGGSGIGDGMIERQQMNPDMAYQMPSIDGSPMAIPQQPMQPTGNPMAGMGGYDQNAAMQGKSGFAPMNEGMPAKKPGTNWAGIAADFLAGMAGQPGPFAAQQQHERAMQQRRQEAELTRQQGFQDYVRKAEYDRANPKQSNNDTISDVNWYMDATKEQQDAYHRLHPVLAYRKDGSPYQVDPRQLDPTTPTFGGWPDEGGQTGAPSATFRPRKA